MSNSGSLKTTRLKLTSLVGLIALSSMLMSQGAVSPGLAKFAAVWPEYAASIPLINSLPSLMIIPASLLAGRLADRGRVSYRALALTGMLICAFGGVAPVLVTSFPAVLVCRAVYGLGLGTLMPLGGAMILILIPGERARHYMSITSAAGNVGCIVIQTLGGLLCDWNWKLIFASYLLCLVAFAVMLPCLPRIPRPLPNVKRDKKRDLPLGRRIFGWALLHLSFNAGFFVITNTIAGVIVGNGYGTASSAGYALSLFTVGGFFGALTSSRVFAWLRSFTLPAAAFIAAAGFAVLILGNSLALMYAGAFIFGLGFGCWNPTIMACGGRSVPPANTATALSLMSCLGNVGSFASSYITAALTSLFAVSWDRFGLLVGMTIFLAITVILLVYALRSQRNKGPLCVA